MQNTLKHVCTTAERVKNQVVDFVKNVDWKKVAVTAGAIGVGIALTVATGGLGAPLAMAIGGAAEPSSQDMMPIVLAKAVGNWLVRLLKEQEQVLSQALLAVN